MVNGNSQFNNSASFAVIPTAPTAATGTSNTQIATTEFVSNSILTNSVLNSNTQNGLVKSGTSNSIWGTDANGNPDWRSLHFEEGVARSLSEWSEADPTSVTGLYEWFFPGNNYGVLGLTTGDSKSGTVVDIFGNVLKGSDLTYFSNSANAVYQATQSNLKIDDNLIYSLPFQKGYGTSSIRFGETETVQALGEYSFAGGAGYPKVEGYIEARKTSALGFASFSYGLGTVAQGTGSVAFGYRTHAKGFASFASGIESQALGFYSQAIGWGAVANGSAAIAMGYRAEAKSLDSVAIGTLTQATTKYQIVLGIANEADTASLLIIGNGTYQDGNEYIPNTLVPNDTVSRSNALTLSRAGDLTLSGGITVANTAIFSAIAYAPTAAIGTSTTQIATTEFVNTEINSNKINSAGSSTVPVYINNNSAIAITALDIAHGGTNATTALDAISNLGGPSLASATEIPEGDDLNDYLSSGKTYNTTNSTHSQKINNAPVSNSAFKLYTQNIYGNYRQQIAFAYHNDTSSTAKNPNIFIRNATAANANYWQPWYKTAMIPSTTTIINRTINGVDTPIATTKWSQVGGSNQLIYVDNFGIIKSSSATVGSAEEPVFLNNGIITKAGVFQAGEVVFYGSQTTTNAIYISTDIALPTNTTSPQMIYGNINGAAGASFNNSKKVFNINFAVETGTLNSAASSANSTTAQPISKFYYYDSTNSISNFIAYKGTDNKIYFSFNPTVRYGRFRTFIHNHNEASNKNRVISMSYTKPAAIDTSNEENPFIPVTENDIPNNQICNQKEGERISSVTTFSSTANTLTLKADGVEKTTTIINSITATLTAGTSSAAPKIKVSVNDITSNEVTLTTATTTAYGVVKTIDAYTSADSNSNAVLTGKAVSSLFAEMVSINDAMVFKGVVATSAVFATVLEDSYKAGWVYRANGTFFLSGSNRTYYVEPGDIIICTKDKEGSNSSISDWQVIEHNIDGALYKGNTAFSGSKILLSSGTNGAVVEGTTSTANVIQSITWNTGTLPTTGTSFSVPNVTGNTTVTASKVTITPQTVVTVITQASSTSTVIGSVFGGVLTFSAAITAVGDVTATTTNISNIITTTDVTATKVTLGTAFSIPNITSVGTLPTLTSTTVSVISNIA